MRIKKVTLHGVGPFEHQEIKFREGKNPDLADVTLLVGENGTGKSTILYAIADALLGDADRPWSTRIKERMHDMTTSSIRLETDPSEALVFERVKHLVPSEELPAWAAFAYGGFREFADVHVSAIADEIWNPLAGTLSFATDDNSERFAQWLANTNYFRLQEKERDPKAPNKYLNALSRLEQALSDVLGESVAFEFPTKHLTPKVRLRGKSLSFAALPDGLKSILSWIGDIHMRHDLLDWRNSAPLEQREFLLLLDEVDVHLHPAWQRRVLPLAQRLFPKAQIIATTHSPLVVASADDAHVVVLQRGARGTPVVHDLDAQIGSSYSSVLRSVFGINSEFDKDTQEHLDKLHELKRDLLSKKLSDRSAFDELAHALAARSEELSQIVAYEKRQLDRQLTTH